MIDESFDDFEMFFDCYGFESKEYTDFEGKNGWIICYNIVGHPTSKGKYSFGAMFDSKEEADKFIEKIKVEVDSLERMLFGDF